MATKHAPEEYKDIDKWHRNSGSLQYYIDHLQKLAAAEGAPLNALYKRFGTTTWVTTDDLRPDHPHFHHT